MASVELAFQKYGSSHAPALIILHGFFASSRNWKLIAERLADAFHVVLLDLRNHGVSPHHPVMDYPSMADDVYRFVAQHNLSGAHLLGHSMGGKIAMWIALNEFTEFSKLIVVDIAPMTYKHSFRGIIQALRNLPLTSIKSRKQAEVLLANTIPDLSYRQFLLQNLNLKEGHYEWRIDLNIFDESAANVVGFPDTSNLNPFTDKALFIVGEASDFVDPRAVYPLFPSAQIQILAGAGHWLHSQNPEGFISAVRRYLQTDM